MNKLFVYLLLVLPLVAVQCRKEEERALTPLPAELKAYAYFLPGTYWIYRDSASGRLDSVWVTSAHTWVRKTKGNGRVKDHNEELEVHTASSASATGRQYQTHCVCQPDSSVIESQTRELIPCWWIERSALRDGDRDGTSADVFFYALRWDHPEVLQVSWAVARAWRHSAPQRLVGGRVVRRVVEVSTTADLSEGGVPARYWWGKGLGVVQLRLYRPTGIQTRTLVRERIVQ